jgi:pectin methylesterase-like acyl-CoA thioesterase
MKRLTFTLTLALIAGGVTAAGGYSAHAANGLCVGSKPGCFATIQAAVDAANDGDTITIAPGTFAGGVAIDVSVNIRGAGAGATTISGGLRADAREGVRAHRADDLDQPRDDHRRSELVGPRPRRHKEAVRIRRRLTSRRERP